MIGHGLDKLRDVDEELRALIDSGPLAHVSTIDRDGSPYVNVIWIGLDGDTIVSGHRTHKRILRNMERDPRVVLSFTAPRDHDAFLQPYAVIRARAMVEATDQSWQLLDRLAKVYMQPDSEFPGEKGPGYITRYAIETVSGIGPWAAR